MSHAPARSLDRDRADVARRRSQREQRPMLGRIATVRADTDVRRAIRRLGQQRDGEGLQRLYEALASALQAGLLLRPAAEESLGAKIARERGDLLGFGRREE